MRARVALGAVLLAAPSDALHGQVEHRFAGLVSGRLLAADGGRSFLDGGLGKLRFDETDEPLALGVALLDYQARVAPTLAVRGVTSVYDDVDRAVDLNEAYLDWRPVPRSAWRAHARAGAFHAPLSLENTAAGWTSPYALSSSAINTWLGEELRTIGLEAQATRLGAPSGSPHDLGVVLGLFQGNDPAGALITWRGWALHDRQTRLFERLPLADLPGFADSGSFPPQDAFEEPFKEIDGRTGGYVGVQWDWVERSRLRLHRYDNNGDPTVVEDGQWAWDTRFDALGWHLRLPREVEVIAQALRGTTRMDGFEGPLVLADYEAWFVLVSRAWSRHRATLRRDDFRVRDEDGTPDDPNQERGSAWTVAWLLDGPPARHGRWRLGVEAQRVESTRPARTLFAQRPHQRESSVQVVGEWRF